MNTNQSIAFKQSDFDELKVIASRFKSCVAMLDLVHADVASYVITDETNVDKALSGVIALMDDTCGWLTCVVKNVSEANKGKGATK